jgi:DinB superfamily
VADSATVIAGYLAALREAPDRIAASTAIADAATLHRRTPDEPWSVNDIVAHLRAAADVRVRFVDAMATGDHATMRYQSPRSELRKTDYPDRPFAENLAALRVERAAFVDRLDRWPAQGWSRGSLIRDRPETVESYVRALTEHEAAHLEQIAALVDTMRVAGRSR